MGTDKEDTDPSSPSALRPNSQPAGASAVAHALKEPPSAQPTTNPGLGPSAAPPPASVRRPMAVTVPAPSVRPRPGPSAITPPEFRPIAAPSSAPSSNKDSVELLLEGMAGPRPDRRKTTPQSDGEASAAYHAEHGVRRARTSEPAGPKVVVERPAPAGSSRERPSSPRAVKPAPGLQDALSTFVPARVLRRRAAMALVAGVLIVLLSFMALRLTGRRDAPAPASTAETMEPPTSTVEVKGSPAEVKGSPAEAKGSPAGPTGETTALTGATSASPDEAPSPAASAPATAAVVEPAAPTASTHAPEAAHASDSKPTHSPGGPSTRHHRATPGEVAPAGQASDLGEFKSKF